MKRLLITCALLAGCTDYGPVTQNQIDIGNTCAAIAAARAPSGDGPGVQAGIEDLRQRAAFSEPELTLIANGHVVAGMSEKAGICALGGNGVSADSVGTATTPGHVMKTFTFDTGPNSPPVLLYTDNGVVTGTS